MGLCNMQNPQRSCNTDLPTSTVAGPPTMQMDACLFMVLLLLADLLTAQEPAVSSEPERPATRSAERRPRSRVRTPRTGTGEASPDRGQAEARKPGRRKPPPPVRETGKTPLPDMGLANYLGRPGGLYPGRSNQPPEEHLTAGLIDPASRTPR